MGRQSVFVSLQLGPSLTFDELNHFCDYSNTSCFVNCDFPVYSIFSSMVSRAALTSLLGQGQSMEGVVVPGSKSTKYKRERDLVGLSGNQVIFCKTCISLSVPSLLIVFSFSSTFLSYYYKALVPL